MQPVPLAPRLDPLATRHVAVVTADGRSAESLHLFFRLMEVECSPVDARDAVSMARRLRPDAIVLDLDLPDRCALRIVSEIRAALPRVAIVLLGDRPEHEDLPDHTALVRKPHGELEVMLQLFEMILRLERPKS